MYTLHSERVWTQMFDWSWYLPCILSCAKGSRDFAYERKLFPLHTANYELIITSSTANFTLNTPAILELPTVSEVAYRLTLSNFPDQVPAQLSYDTDTFLDGC